MLISYKHILENGAKVNARKYYYVLDALDCNDISIKSLINKDYTYVNQLNEEEFNILFEKLVKLELDDTEKTIEQLIKLKNKS